MRSPEISRLISRKGSSVRLALDRVKSISALSAHSAVKGLIGTLIFDVVKEEARRVPKMNLDMLYNR